MPDLLLGIDVGTSGTKALLLAGDGRVLATATVPHSLQTPRAGVDRAAPARMVVGGAERRGGRP